MRKIIALMLLSAAVCSVKADNLFQNSNPFPQTSIQNMNNIYEAQPKVMQREQKKETKSWFKKDSKSSPQEITQDKNQYKLPVYPVPHEGQQNESGFYMFTTGQ